MSMCLLLSDNFETVRDMMSVCIDHQYGLSIGTDIGVLELCDNARVWQTDRQTDRQTEMREQHRAYAVAR